MSDSFVSVSVVSLFVVVCERIFTSLLPQGLTTLLSLATLSFLILNFFENSYWFRTSLFNTLQALWISPFTDMTKYYKNTKICQTNFFF